MCCAAVANEVTVCVNVEVDCAVVVRVVLAWSGSARALDKGPGSVLVTVYVTGRKTVLTSHADALVTKSKYSAKL